MRSIRSRLVALLLPVTALALLLTALGIERAVRGDLEAAFDGQMLLLAQGIGAAVDIEVDGRVEFELEDGDMPELEASARESFYAVADEEGAVLFSSGPVPPGLLASGGELPVFRDTLIEGEQMRICLLSILREPQGDEEDVEEWLVAHPGLDLPDIEPRRFIVAAGRSNRPMSDAIALLRKRLSAGFGLLALLLVLFPLWASGRSLRPLRRLSGQADAVGPERPEARLDESAADDEVRPLVSALNAALGRLGSAYDRQRRFTADAAHELRSPLSALRTQCEVNLRRRRSGEELEEVIRSVHRTTLRLSGVVESLLSLSRIEGSGSSIEMKPFNLAEAARQVVGGLSSLAAARETEVVTSLPESIAVTGDERLLSECLSNILHNAICYTPRGGRISVEGGGGQRPWITVADTGIGIAEGDVERIFERFYRADPARSRDDGGSGLGLSIAQAIARLHGAVITVKSRRGEGSRFTVEFGDSRPLPPDSPREPVAGSCI